MTGTCSEHGAYEPIACGRCGDFTCPACSFVYHELRFCRPCTEPAILEREPAWESALYKFGTGRAYSKTATAALFQPTAFWKRMPWRAGASKPVGFFAFATTLLGCPLAALWTGATYFLVFSGGSTWGSSARVTIDNFALVFNVIAYLPLVPLILVLGAGAWYHALARLLGGRGTFDVTMRVLGYSWGSLWIFALLPGLGLLPALIWGLALPAYGLREGYGLSTPRAALIGASPVVAAVLLAAAALLLA